MMIHEKTIRLNRFLPILGLVVSTVMVDAIQVATLRLLLGVIETATFFVHLMNSSSTSLIIL